MKWIDVELSRASAALVAAALVCVLPVRQADAACDCTILPTLGRAGDYPAMGINDILVYLQGNTLGNTLDVPGNIGMTGDTYPPAEVRLDGSASVGGKVDHHPGSQVRCTPISLCTTAILGGINERDMSGPHADLLAFSAALSAMTPTQTYGSITRTTTISGNGCINVIQVNGNIDLGGKSALTFSGSSDDYFVVNVTGDVLTSGTAELLLNGMEPSNVVVNLLTPGKRVELGGDSGGDFTIVVPYGSAYLHGTSGGTGAYYAGVDKLHFQGSVTYYGDPFTCTDTSCPDPELTGANIQTPATPQGRGFGSTSFFYAYFDLSDYEGHLEHFRLDAAGVIRSADLAASQAVNPATREFYPLSSEPGGPPYRTPYWDAAVGLRTNGGRNLQTTIAGAQVAFTKANVSEADLNLDAGEVPAYPNHPGSGVTTTALLRDAVVDYLHGRDAFQEHGADPTALRPTVLGDIFHSNPLFVGSPTTILRHEPGFEVFYQGHVGRDRVVYAGANDGIFHAFDAGESFDPDDPDPTAFKAGTGAELFGYVPGLLLPSVKLVPRTEDAAGNRLAPSFVDGNIVAADAWLTDGSGSDASKEPTEWATVLMAAFREGGQGYLTMDVSDPSDAAYPKMLWEFTDTRMAESWSRPVITRIRMKTTPGFGDKCGVNDGDGDCREQWVAIFAGGYNDEADPNDRDYESDETSPSYPIEGKAVFVVDILTGDVLARMAYDTTPGMKYAMPSQPGVLDLDGDRFADLVVIGDLAGQVWKWDVSAKGEDTDADDLVDNWPYGVFFAAASEVINSDVTRYKSFFYPPSAAYVNGRLTYAFASGERRELLYYGDPAKDENNRIWVIQDPNPTGASAIPAAPYTEANLTDITTFVADTDLTDMGFFLKVPDGEKFLTDVLIFAGHLIVASYNPDTYPSCGPGEARLYIMAMSNGLGYFDANGTPEAADRSFQIGTGIPSTPRISVSPNPTDDIGFINTSDKKVLTFEPPLRDPPESSVLYWKQEF